MATRFRLHPEPGTERKASFHPGKAIYNTVRSGGIGSALLIPHITVPIYGIYVVLHRTKLWTPEFERGLAFAVALIQGISFGSVIALSIVRYSASGKAIKGRRIEKTATDEEESKQHRIEVALRLAAYLFLGTILWEYLVHSKYSPIIDERAKETSSGFLTATGPLRRFFNNESILPQPRESRDQISGLGLNFDLQDKAQQLKKAVDNSPRIRVPGTAPPPKSVFLETYEKVWKKLTGGPRVGLFEIGPKNWE
ncbi:hypothetical protein EX895_006162 [Sporisorium graminicola]|uniref:Uncharacterized protein n=1 Tax=Sporisorium graminicola TaxID=280036 RepID=A0A4U7KQ14_9BASI|nr:hypothetical protein EX895_006162 [Sporisorium graminicola]TKY85082.1 hypothetical protein EX895_006162 [Sporisorium graminicola]